MTVAEAVKQATTRLAAEPLFTADAARDAELLLLFALSIERTELFAHPERLLTAREQTHFASLVQQRLVAMPIQYITGVQEFFSLRLRVTPDVLIPRPETEHLVEALLARMPQDRPVTIADVGTGSGAIAVAAAYRLPLAQVTAIDNSPAALAVAKGNATRHQVADRIEFMCSDLLEEAGGRSFDVIVSNPPYIAFKDQAGMHPQVRDHEPAQALFAGVTGLEIFARLIPQAWEALHTDGWLMLEIGSGQQMEIADLLCKWKEVSFEMDLQKIPRVAIARKP
jgi:release factor glutamine methyltransferase